MTTRIAMLDGVGVVVERVLNVRYHLKQVERMNPVGDRENPLDELPGRKKASGKIEAAPGVDLTRTLPKTFRLRLKNGQEVPLSVIKAKGNIALVES